MMRNEQSVDKVPVIYSNNLRLGLNFTDVKLFFAERMPPPFDSEARVGEEQQTSDGILIDRVCIVLSPDILPHLIQGLMTAATVYQSKYGPLRPLPGLAGEKSETEKNQ